MIKNGRNRPMKPTALTLVKDNRMEAKNIVSLTREKSEINR